jgi:hypothetical protein
VSQAEGSSTSNKSSGNVGFQVAAATGGWREGLIIPVMVLAPIGLAAILMAIGISVIAVWQIVHGTPVNLPTPANIRPYGFSCPTLSPVGSPWRSCGSGRRAGGLVGMCLFFGD